MATSGNSNSWEIIQRGVRDTERLIGQKQYNLAMVKARQTLEFMVNLLSEKACIVDGELIDVIDALYQGRWITKTTCEHYHKVRMIGNKAVHEGSDNAYDANQAYHLLSQEIHTFANEYAGKRSSTPRPGSTASRSSGARPRPAGSQASGTGSRSSGSRPASRSGSSSGSRTAAATRSRKKQGKGNVITPYDLLKLLIPVLCIVLLIVLIRFIKPSDDKKPETTVPITTETEVLPTETTVPQTMPTETTAPPRRKTTTAVNVRPEPNTEQARVGRLDKGAEVEFIQEYNEEWSEIRYDGKTAYINSQYLATE